MNTQKYYTVLKFLLMPLMLLVSWQADAAGFRFGTARDSNFNPVTNTQIANGEVIPVCFYSQPLLTEGGGSENPDYTVCVTLSNGFQIGGISSGFLDPGVIANNISYTLAFNVPMTFTEFQIGEFTNLSDGANYVFTPNTGTALTLANNSPSISGSIATLNPTDWNGITSLTVSYAGAQAWRLGLDNMGFTADPVVKITSATYDASSGNLVVTGSGFEANAGAANDVAVSNLTLTGEGGATYTLTTADVEIDSSTQFTVSLNSTDKLSVDALLNKNSTSADDGTTYNLAAADDFIANVTAGNTADATNGVTVSNYANPTITSSAYDVSSGALVVTGTGFSSILGATNDVVANTFTFTGDSGNTYTLTDSANVDVTSTTAFTLTLSATDKTNVNTLLNKNGLNAASGQAYNLAAADNWMAGGATSANIADPAASITVSNVISSPDAPTIGTATAGNAQATISFTEPANNGGAAITSFTVTSSPGGLSASGAGSPLTVTGLTNGTAYTFTVTATNSAGVSAASSASNSVTPFAQQTITFVNPGAQNFGTSPTLTATSDSGLTVSFTSSTTGVCTITTGGALTFASTGTCTINADQAGNATFSPAPQVTQSFSVNAVAADAPVIGTATAGNAQATISFTAPANNGGAAITSFTVTSSPGGLSASGAGSPLTVTGLTNGTAYTFTVTATNSAGVSAASSASNSITPFAQQTITFVNPGAQNFGTTPTLTATSDSGLTVSFTSSTAAVCTITTGGTLTFVATGSCTINADQAGNAMFSPAAQVSQTFAVNAVAPDAPIIGTATAGDAQATVSFTPPSNSGGAAITGYTVTSSPGGITANGLSSPLTVTGLTNGTAYTFTVKANSSAGASAASASSNSVTPKKPNSAPVANDANVSLDEDTSLSISFTATDAENDVLSFEVVTEPTSGKLVKHGVLWLYTPNADFNGDDSLRFIAKDAELSSEPATVSIKVEPVNDEPKALDDSYSRSLATNDSYTLAVLDNDTDVDGDTLILDGAAADVGSVQIVSSQLHFQAPTGFVGPVALRYTISDGQKGRSNAKVSLMIGGDSSADAPVITVPADVTADASGLFTKLKLGVATAVDSSGNKLAVSLVNTKQLFAPGEHLAYWQAIDSQGRSAIKSQKVMVKPLISISRNLVVAEGNEAKVTVFLNGPSPEYPVSIPYTVSGSSDSNDHDLIDGVVEITSGLSTTFTVNVFEDGEADADETIIITLDSSINISPQSQMHLLISEANVAPQTSIKITQSNEPRTQVSKLEGKVYIKAISQDVNTQDSLTEVWSTGDLVLETDAQGMYFDPSLVAAGSYPISLTVTDNGTPTLSTKVQLSLLVKESLPELTGADSDGDLIPDNVEGFADTDGDGIADYLDAINDCNVVQQQGREQSLFLAESQSGVCLRLGNTAQRNGSEGMKVLTSALTTDTEATNIGGIYDFEAVNLPTPGNSYRFSLPQTLPVPANAVYRKFNNANGWKAFILDDKNSIASSAGERGLCPPPGSTLWQSGLNEGHWCVQLTIEDGGPNDDDGITNGSIVDPGGVAVMLNSNTLPVAAAEAVKVPVNQTAEIDVLANDTDADGDSLTLTQVSADFGQASISSDMTKVIYTPAVDFIGTDTLTYGVSDGKGGTASAQATVTVYINQAPQVTQVTASTDDRTAIDINVLANASDADGDTLSITAAAATEGTVTITNGAMLRYVPKAGFDGTDRISFAISDGRSGVAQGEVLVTVNAYEVITVVNKSSGGSVSGWPVALLALLVALRRRSAIATAFIALLCGMSFSAQANWSVDGLYGHSKAKQSASTISAKLPTGAEIVQYDNSAQSWALGVNYHFSSALSMQVHYVDLGETSLTLRADTLTPDTFYQSVQDIGPTQAEGISSGLSYRLWQHAGWTAGVHAGLFFWKSESSSTAGDITVRYQADDTDVYWGLNAGYSLDTHVMIKTSFTRYHLDGNKVDNLMFGVSYHF